MTKIVYLKCYTGNELDDSFDYFDVLEMDDKEALDCITKHPEGVAIYNTFEDFAEAFNNGYISDEGWIRVIKYENT